MKSWIATVVAAAILLAACGQQEGADGKDAPQVSARASLFTVKTVELPSRYVTSGTVTSDHRVAISSRLSGYILELNIREGDRVEKGQVLVNIDPVHARQALIQAQADLSNARAELKRYEELYKAGAETKQQVERVELRYKLAASQVAQARNQLSYSKVRSPVTGVVVEKRMSKGDLAAPGAAILILEDPASLLVETHVSEQFVGGIQVGDQVDVEVAALGRSFAGSVHQVVQAADAVSHQFLIKIVLQAYNGVRPGMYAQAGFTVGSRKALLIPAQAVIEQAGLHGLYIVDGEGVARYRQIRVGQAMGDKIEVLAGLSAGDVIAWQGEPTLKSGMRVQAR